MVLHAIHLAESYSRIIVRVSAAMPTSFVLVHTVTLFKDFYNSGRFRQTLSSVAQTNWLHLINTKCQEGASVMSQILTKGGVLSDKLSDNSPQLQRSGHRVEGR
ncbi:hypothetical protein F7725_016021 [Dissostichus mawsoni]|uniref:Uncharacterized protein n=1 Tax=Dissostichus mawsoni TaxID=36200 RepID=A0A7J5Y4C2_DISMA|nr:hypothetical protein F7725_016021 [Dissostichus mawsoni]